MVSTDLETCSEKWAVTHRRKWIGDYLIPATVPKMGLKRGFFKSFQLGQKYRQESSWWNLPKQRWLLLPAVTEACGHSRNLSGLSQVLWNHLQKSEGSSSHRELTGCFIHSVKCWIILWPSNQHHQTQWNHSIGQVQSDKTDTRFSKVWSDVRAWHSCWAGEWELYMINLFCG